MNKAVPCPSLGCRAAALMLSAAGVILAAAPVAMAVTHLRRGDKPPAVALPDAQGGDFTLAAQRGRPVVLLFGELYHENSLKACRVLQSILADARVAETNAICVMIVAQQIDAAALRIAAQERSVTMPVLHDRQRRVFAAYEVSVLPSAVIIDRDGLVVHAVASLTPSFQDIVTDGILYGAGKLGLDQLQKALHPASRPDESIAAVRAARLTELARQLDRSGMSDLAVEKYREALALEPRYVPALVGLGRCALDRGRLAEAEEYFRAALAVDVKSAGANLGIAYVRIARGGSELPLAEQQVRALVAERPGDAEAHYLLGLIHDQSGRSKEAAASFRKSAELLLGQSVREQ